MTQLEITFLGTTAGVPTPHRNHASIYFRYQSENEFVWLFDCGEGTQRQIFYAGLNFMRINDIFITHWHADHFAGLLGLLQTMNLEGRKRHLNVYGPEASKFMPLLLELSYSTKDFDVNIIDVNFEGRKITTLMETDEFEIRSVPVKHGIPAVAYGFFEKERIKIDKKKAAVLGLPPKGPIFKKLKEKGATEFRGRQINIEELSITEKGKIAVYSGDTLPSENMEEFCKNADLLIHDSTFFMEECQTEKNYRHTTFDAVMKIAGNANVKDVIATHISRRYQNTEELKNKINKYKNARLSKDFMKIIL